MTTLAAGADAPLSVSFAPPTETSPLKPGPPAWSNYVKGVVANFKGKSRVFYSVSASDFVLFAACILWSSFADLVDLSMGFIPPK